MIPFEVVQDGERVLSDWPLEDRERRALITMLVVMFQVHEFERALNTVIFKTNEPDLFYAKATGKIQLRPRCTLGLERPRMEVDFLVRAIKKGNKIIPNDANDRAREIREDLHAGKLSRIRYRPMPPKTDGTADGQR